MVVCSFFRPMVLALALGAGGSGMAHAATNAELVDMLEKLGARVQRLEQINAELQKQLAAPSAARPPDAMEAAEAAAKVTIVEDVVASEAAPAASFGMSLTMAAQKSYAPGLDESQLGYRADFFGTLPLERVGGVDQSVFVQFRMGQGAGLTALPGYAKTNAAAFSLQGGLRPDDSVALLAQAWYQASIPLSVADAGIDARRSLEVTFGKMDPFVFFDQNAVAGDEAHQFLNAALVHNPLLDTGGDIGVDANGFTPGLRVSLFNGYDALRSWRLSLGVLGAGSTGANYQRSLGTPLVMLQAETSQGFLGGLLGNYRVYAWSNPQALHFDPALTAPETHSGWGLSMDQRLSEGLTVFGRYGLQSGGHVRFDRALTLGAEASGAYWGRGDDGVGLGLGWLRTSDAYRDFTAATSLISGTERIAELYYRYRVGKQFELTPSVQFIGAPGGDPNAQDVRVLGLRSQFTY